MEHGPLKYVWTRWPVIICMLFIGFFGLYSLAVPGVNDIGILFIMIKVVVTTVAFSAAITRYTKGVAYQRETRILLNELDTFEEFENGLIVATGGMAKHIVYNCEKIQERGYIKVNTNYDRKKKAISWRIWAE